MNMCQSSKLSSFLYWEIILQNFTVKEKRVKINETEFYSRCVIFIVSLLNEPSKCILIINLFIFMH